MRSVLAACMADWWLPRRAFAQDARSAREEARAPRDRRDVRRRRALRGHAGPRRLGQHSAPRHRSSCRRDWSIPSARYEGLTGHFNSTGALVTGSPPERRRLRQRGAGDADDLRAVPQGTRAPAGRSLGDRHQQELRPDGRQQAPGVRRSVLGQRRPAEAAPDRDDQVGGEHRVPGPASKIGRRSPSG